MPSSAPDALAEVDVGERLRDIRRLRRATLRTVAARAGVSESFLSQVERGRASASIASLRRIAGALGVSVADLFEPGGPPRPRVLRREERPSLAFGTLGRKLLLTPRPLQHLEVFVGELDPGGSTGAEPYAHGDSEELFVVLTGSVQLELGGDRHELGTGDSIDYRSSTPHRVTNVGEERAEVMWIISPPSY
ncbi:MAG: cupin domain-containing protein [Actinobacteria bacterium]|nr:MAG: cupin domain-containing protein [Actinomycetota bacterium]